jgi:hypothetical protein
LLNIRSDSKSLQQQQQKFIQASILRIN